MSRSPARQPETGCARVNVVLPARGSCASRVQVGVFSAPYMSTVPYPTRPVPSSVGSVDVFGDWFAMTISAVTPSGTGALAVPAVSVPAWYTRIVATVSRVLAPGVNESFPRTPTHVSAVSFTTSYVTVSPASTRTRSPDPGTRLGDHVDGSDHAPDLALAIVEL